MKLSAAIAFLVSAPSACAMGKGCNELSYEGVVTITNLAPTDGTCQTPVWVGIHDGTFDTYNRGETASSALESIAEDGQVAPLISLFEADGGIWYGVVGNAPICPGEFASLAFELTVRRGKPLYFSYASMVLPSNDAFVSNGNPEAHRLIRPNGRPDCVEFVVKGSEVLDAGTEVNDELPENTAFLAQMAPNTGEDQNGVVGLHPGFKEGRNILTAFPGGDFTLPGYEMMKVEVILKEKQGNRRLRGSN